MPVILSQIFEASDRAYKDAEWSLYHYPRQYFSRVRPYDAFIYYRPHGKRALREDSSKYFGHGILGKPFEDPFDPSHRYVPLIKCEPFQHLVSLKDPRGVYYETESERSIQGQSAVRDINEVVYHRILAAANVASLGISMLPSTEEIAALSYFGPPIQAPMDSIRVIKEIPEGSGYVPHPGHIVDVYESAALQERARSDHQHILRLVHAAGTRRGATCWYNNNIDLVLDFGDERSLIEAKSLNDLRDAVHRMRYGIGQLKDYQIRYSAKLKGAKPVIAFGRAPNRETSFIATVLEESGISFITQNNGELIPLNDSAKSLQLFH